jgi:hypothetical protein
LQKLILHFPQRLALVILRLVSHRFPFRKPLSSSEVGSGFVIFVRRSIFIASFRACR